MKPEIVQPGRYDYHLCVRFPSVYIPEHTPPAFRDQAAIPTTRTRTVYGEFDLTAPADHDGIRDHFIDQMAIELMLPPAQIEFVRFDLKHTETI
ncbi:hypothetical protein ACFYVL_43895 [Streptomyces sp. NPDC004111]|uniref:hypothetical protein n=1 Tax=Streptomyces sp. NPDC004111 TaxID=3364690 RepID=UPI0036AEF8A1